MAACWGRRSEKRGTGGRCLRKSSELLWKGVKLELSGVREVAGIGYASKSCPFVNAKQRKRLFLQDPRQQSPVQSLPLRVVTESPRY